jgi:hypothetical protein
MNFDHTKWHYYNSILQISGICFAIYKQFINLEPLPQVPSVTP